MTAMIDFWSQETAAGLAPPGLVPGTALVRLPAQAATDIATTVPASNIEGRKDMLPFLKTGGAKREDSLSVR
jgi:hypothetical protein